jgi:hypothetical protein
MSHTPITHMTLYKHGVGFFCRRGVVEGEEMKLTFRREEMNDILKSLTVIDHGGGQVRGIDYGTPQSQEERLSGCSVQLAKGRSLRDLLEALRGRQVQITLKEGATESGLLLGLDEDGEKPLNASFVPLLREGAETVAVIPIADVQNVELLEDEAAADLRFFLQTALGQETHRSVTVRLSPGEHDLEVSYIAPASTWRVSYRLVLGDGGAEPEAFLQGWGIFDNRLEEDLTGISLSLVAGMPISFVYDLYTPFTPERPVVEEEKRVAAAPVAFEGAVLGAEEAKAAPAPGAGVGLAAGMGMMMMRSAAPLAPEVADTTQGMAQTAPVAASGQPLGELFQYVVSAPVTVGRGQSAMVPIVEARLPYRKDLIYNGAKMPVHPVATVRMNNNTGLTLERGPVTALEGLEYVGEAVLPFTTAGDEMVVSYAVELGVRVRETVKSEQETQGLKVKKAYLVFEEHDIRRTTYRAENRTPKEVRVLVEHPRSGTHEIFDTPQPEETTGEQLRYAVTVGAGGETEFTVSERRLTYRSEELKKQSYSSLKKYLKNKWLDEDTYEDMSKLLEMWGRIDVQQANIAEQEQRRQEIYKAQEQIQKSMSVLSATGKEGELRARYVDELEKGQEELAAIEKLIAGLREQIAKIEKSVEGMVAKLEQ